MLDSNGFIDQGDIIFNDAELSDTVVPLNSYAKKTIASTWEAEGDIQTGIWFRSISENEGSGAGKEEKMTERGRARESRC